MVDDANARIGANVRRLREHAGLSQAELAERLTMRGLPGMHPQTITKIEAGQRTLKLLEGLELSSVLGVSPWGLNQLGQSDLERATLLRETTDAMRVRRRAVDALYDFICSAECLRDLIEKARVCGVPPADIALARTLADSTVADVEQMARARIAGELAQDDVERGAWTPSESLDGLSALIEEEERLAHGEHSEEA